MNPEEFSDEEQAKACIECRKVRLYLASHPGLTAYEIRQALGTRSDRPLFYMLSLGIVTFTQQKEDDGRRPQRWYVIPQ